MVAAFKGKWLKRPDPEPPQADPPSGAQESDESEDARVMKACPYCRGDESAVFKADQLHHPGIWLHALKYKGSTWEFETPPPPWAVKDYYDSEVGVQAVGMKKGVDGDGVAVPPPTPPVVTPAGVSLE